MKRNKSNTLFAVVMGAALSLSLGGMAMAQQTQDNQDSADTSAAIGAAVEQVQEAADNLAVSTPDPDTIEKSQILEYRRELDAESKTDGELAKEGVLDQLPSGIEPDVERPDLGAFDAVSDAFEAAKAFTEASTPSYTAGPTLDEGPAFTPEETQDVDDEMDEYQDAQQQYQQALQNLSNQNLVNAIQQPIWKNLPSPAQVQQSRGPQIGASQCSGVRCF